MHMNEYVLEFLTRERLAEMRAEGERSARLWRGIPASRSRRGALLRTAQRVYGVLGHAWAAVSRDAVKGERTPVGGALRD